MKNYELTLVLPEKATPAKKKSLTELVEKIAKTFKGKLVKTEDWGKIDFAFPIQKTNAGQYIHFVLELDTIGAKAVKDKIRVEDGILKHLLIRQEVRKIKTQQN